MSHPVLASKSTYPSTFQEPAGTSEGSTPDSRAASATDSRVPGTSRNMPRKRSTAAAAVVFLSSTISKWVLIRLTPRDALTSLRRVSQSVAGRGMLIGGISNEHSPKLERQVFRET